jgi:hypothetical protein
MESTAIPITVAPAGNALSQPRANKQISFFTALPALKGLFVIVKQSMQSAYQTNFA